MQEISFTRVTLALDIIGKIPLGPHKGFHELGIIKHQIDLGDGITIEPSFAMGLTCKYLGVPEDASNICWQAARLLQKKFSIEKNVHISIDKQIPVQGGLAGGSTNAATTLSLLNKLWKLGLNPEELAEIGRELGMDVPFYFYGSTCYDSEATGVLRVVEHPLTLYFVLVVPPFGVSTAEAYVSLDYELCGQATAKTALLEEALRRGDRATVAENMHNDFEISVFKAYPVLREIRNSLLGNGALAVCLSGSGSTIVGLAKSKSHAKEIAVHYERSFVVKSCD